MNYGAERASASLRSLMIRLKDLKRSHFIIYSLNAPSSGLTEIKISPKKLIFLNWSCSLIVLSIFLTIKKHSFSYPNIAGFTTVTNLCTTPFETNLLTLFFAALGVIPTAKANYCKEL
jgi:hypothetical protein